MDKTCNLKNVKFQQYFQYKEAVEKYKTAAEIGEGCQIGLDSGWQGLIKAYWLVLKLLDGLKTRYTLMEILLCN